MTLQYKSHYFHDPAAKSAFLKYAHSVFELDFTRWIERGLWSEEYVPFSAFVGDKCIAAICVYPSEMTVDGRQEKWAQLLTVGTLPEHRLQGIQRELWRRAQEWISGFTDTTFLFTDETAAGFYEKLGFKRQREFFDIIKLPQVSETQQAKFRKLNVDNETNFAILKRLAHDREPVSEKLGFKNPNLLLFMFLYLFRDETYYLEDSDTVIVARTEGNRLIIYDILAEQMPDFNEIASFFGHFRKQEVEFRFCTDKLDLHNTGKLEVKESILIVSDNFSLEGKFLFPYSIRA